MDGLWELRKQRARKECFQLILLGLYNQVKLLVDNICETLFIQLKYHLQKSQRLIKIWM